MKTRSKFNGDHYVDGNLELILDLSVHPLRVIEWIDDAFEYDETSHSLKIESETFTLNPQVFVMFHEWRARRDQGKIQRPCGRGKFREAG